jgi:hypothetical protein
VSCDFDFGIRIRDPNYFFDAMPISLLHIYGTHGRNGTMKSAKRERLESNQMLWQLAIDRDVQRKFKARCVEAGKTMSEQVEEMIRMWLKKKE